MKYFDGHAHINTQYFKDDLQETIKLAKDYGVKQMIMPSTDVKNSFKSIKLSKEYSFLHAAVGLHPADTFDLVKCDYLNDVNPDDIIAVGEVGIDLYRTSNPSLEIQKQVFEKHLKFAKKHKKVLIIHMREAEEEVFELLVKYTPLKFVMHSFTSSYAWALQFIKIGGYISFSGIVTFKNALSLQNVAKKIPLNRILTETDAPFLTPVPKRGKTNTPAYVKYTTDFVASLRSEDDQIVINQIYKNAINLFFKLT